MCLVIDTCVIGKVFDKNNAQHKKFTAVYAWVTEGTGTVIYGGTKFFKELGHGRYLALFTELRKVRRAINIDTRAVDARASVVKAIAPEKEFDDEHIVALVGVSRCSSRLYG